MSINFGNVHPNPHIRALPDLETEQQLALLGEVADHRFVIYPTPETLQSRADPALYVGRPFSLRLALGAAQLDFASFDLAVIDHYRRDPRYRLWTNDVQGRISVGDDAYLSEDFPEKHKVVLQSFGFSYTPSLKRAVAVFLRYLDGLTPEHQQLWAAFEVQGDYKLHPDFWRAAVMGNWDLKASLRDAFIEEIRTVNAMCKSIGWPPLFRQEYEEPPRELAFLIRPTVAEFNAFVHVLDKLMSDNINSDFFPTTIARESEEERKDGKIVVRQRGTVAMLGEWLRASFRTPDPEPINELLASFREVRKLRQKPAHAVDPDSYDESLFEQQRQLFVKAYNALRTLRMALQNHPSAQAVVEMMDERVREGDIWSY